MWKLSEVNIKLKSKLSETNKIIQSFNMPLLEVLQSKRRKIVFSDNFRYMINKKTPITIYLECFHKCGVRMVANGSLTDITKYPGQHNHEDEVEEVKKRKNSSEIDFSSKERPDESFERSLRKRSWI